MLQRGPNIPAYRQPISQVDQPVVSAADLSPQLSFQPWASAPRLRQVTSVFDARPLNATDVIVVTDQNATDFTYQVPEGYNLVGRGFAIDLDVRATAAATPVTDPYGWTNNLMTIGTSLLVGGDPIPSYPVFNTDLAILGAFAFDVFFLAQATTLVSLLFNVQPSANFTLNRCKVVLYGNLLIDTGSPLAEEPIVSPDDVSAGVVP